MTKEEILNYVMDTPENTNRAVLNDMLDEFSSGGGGSVGVPYIVNVVEEGTVWACESTWAQIKVAYLMGQQVRFNLPVPSEGDFMLEPMVSIGIFYGQYTVGFYSYDGYQTLYCASEDDYPYMSFD